MDTNIFGKFPELKEIVQIIRIEIQRAQRPANEIILDDQDLMRLLKISRRKLQYMKADRIIPFHTPSGTNRSYYLLSDVLNWMEQSRIESS